MIVDFNKSDLRKLSLKQEFVVSQGRKFSVPLEAALDNGGITLCFTEASRSGTHSTPRPLSCGLPLPFSFQCSPFPSPLSKPVSGDGFPSEHTPSMRCYLQEYLSYKPNDLVNEASGKVNSSTFQWLTDIMSRGCFIFPKDSNSKFWITSSSNMVIK